jgi:sterol 24-C-methyltransferase
VFQVLKPGATFAGYEWVFTDKYDARNAQHAAIMRGIEVGDGLPDTTGADDVIGALRKAGFEVSECRDLAPTSQVPWYQPFMPEYTVTGFRTTPVGIYLTSLAVRLMETVGLAPKGTGEMHKHLATAGVTLCQAGQLGIFTPMLHFVAIKPLEGKSPSERNARSRSQSRKS